MHRSHIFWGPEWLFLMCLGRDDETDNEPLMGFGVTKEQLLLLAGGGAGRRRNLLLHDKVAPTNAPMRKQASSFFLPSSRYSSSPFSSSPYANTNLVTAGLYGYASPFSSVPIASNPFYQNNFAPFSQPFFNAFNPYTSPM